MFVAMNRFQIKPGQEEAFEEIWKHRDSFLSDVPGFKGFHLLRGSGDEQHTLYATHTLWASHDAFEAWTKSEAFRKAHAGASGSRDIYAAPAKLELFESVQEVMSG